MTEPNPNAAGDPIIRLAGKDWPIPLLAIRQNRVVVPALSRYYRDAVERAKSPSPLSDANFTDASGAVFAALTRAHPTLTRNEFEDMPIATSELFDALPVVAQQTGILRREDPDTGEAMAQTPPSTGTE